MPGRVPAPRQAVCCSSTCRAAPAVCSRSWPAIPMFRRHSMTASLSGSRNDTAGRSSAPRHSERTSARTLGTLRALWSRQYRRGRFETGRSCFFMICCARPRTEEAMAYQTIEARRLAGALGAIIEGIDLSQELDNAQASDLHQALLDHCVIFFRDQRLGPEQHLALGRRFGTLNIHEFVEAMPGHPEILVVAKYEGDTKNFGGGWHSDVTYLDAPALGSILYALEVPEYGGDTMFANQYMAYEALSSGMQRMLDGLTAVHSARGVYGIDADNTYVSRKGRSAM